MPHFCTPAPFCTPLHVLHAVHASGTPKVLCPSNLGPLTFYKVPYCLPFMSPSIFSFSASVARFHQLHKVGCVCLPPKLPPLKQQIVVIARSTLVSTFGSHSVDFATKGLSARKPVVVSYSTMPVIVDWPLRVSSTQLPDFIRDRETRIPLATFLCIGLPFVFA